MLQNFFKQDEWDVKLNNLMYMYAHHV